MALRLPDVLGEHENTGRQEKLFKRLVRGAKVGTRIDGGDADAPISVVFAADVGAAIARLLEARARRSPAGAMHICCAEAPTWRELVELAAELLRENGIEVPPVVFDDAKENPLVSVDVGALSGAKAARLLPGWAPAPLRRAARRGGGGVGGRDARRVRWADARRGAACAAETHSLIGQTSSA